MSNKRKKPSSYDAALKLPVHTPEDLRNSNLPQLDKAQIAKEKAV